MNIFETLLVVSLVLAQTACSSNNHDSNLNNQTDSASNYNSKLKDTSKIDSKYITFSNTGGKFQQNINSNPQVTTPVQNSKKVITPNGVQNIFLNDTITSIEKKNDTSLDVNSISDKCSVVTFKDLELLFKDDKLISIEVFTPNYFTDKLIKVGDTYNKLISSYPNGKYQSIKSSAGDESYTYKSRYFITNPNAKGNYYSFLLADNNQNVIQSFSINQIPFLQDNGCEI